MRKDKSSGDEITLSAKVLDEILEWAESFVFAVFVVVLIFIFLFRIVLVEGPSMSSTLSDGDRLIISHLNYKPQRGDIVVLNSTGLNKTIIKRCIGVGGDTVRIDYSDSSVTVNGEKLDESYIDERMKVQPMFDQDYYKDGTVYEYNIPEGKIFVLGDNRNHSTDSRSYFVGLVDESDVLGKAVFRLLPFGSFGKIG